MIGQVEYPAGMPLIRRDLSEILPALDAELRVMSGKTLLVTGAAGMLPSYIVDLIAFANEQGVFSQPVEIHALVRTPPTAESRLGHLLGLPHVNFIVQDAVEPVRIAGGVAYVVHAASAASPRWYRRDPVGTAQVNSKGLDGLLSASREWSTEAFLFFSSSEVYGSPGEQDVPTPESYLGTVDFTSGRACYSESKRFGELLCAAYHEQYELPVRVVRPFHVHGPGQRLDDGRIVAEMIRLGLEGRPFELLSDGRATRTYGYISDATIGFLKVLLNGNDGEAYNVGSDSPETSILELATQIAREFGSSEPVKTGSTDVPEHLRGAPDRVCPDLGKIRAQLGFEPRVELTEGLSRTIAWHRAVRHAGLKG